MTSAAIVLVADGLTPEALDEAIRAGDVPELAALRETRQRTVVSTVFPSVTGVAYVPMLTGTHPAEAGIPGLRWFDRASPSDSALSVIREATSARRFGAMDADLSAASPCSSVSAVRR